MKYAAVIVCLLVISCASHKSVQDYRSTIDKGSSFWRYDGLLSIDLDDTLYALSSPADSPTCARAGALVPVMVAHRRGTVRQSSSDSSSWIQEKQDTTARVEQSYHGADSQTVTQAYSWLYAAACLIVILIVSWFIVRNDV